MRYPSCLTVAPSAMDATGITILLQIKNIIVHTKNNLGLGSRGRVAFYLHAKVQPLSISSPPEYSIVSSVFLLFKT